ncbi:MAG: hypothetical protein GY756_12470 [bacterium]|nr:hypothetical protein [bacterium]
MIDYKTELQERMEREINALFETHKGENDIVKQQKEMNWKKNSKLNYYFNTADFSIPSNYSGF